MRPVRKQRARRAGLLLVVAALAGCSGSPAPRHLVLVVFDTLRADRTSLYGYHKPTTPFLEELARESVVYRDVKAPGAWTVPSHASLFTGLWPANHRAQWGSMRLGERFETLAETLAARGFCTTGLSANALAGPKTGLAQGFDDFTVVPGDWPEKTGKILSSLDAVLEEANRRNCRLFLFVNLMDAHIPFNSSRYAEEFGLHGPSPVPNARVKWEINDGQRVLDEQLEAQHGASYDAAVRALDDAARELMSVLGRHDMVNETLLVMTSDHGEGLGAHPEIGHSISVWEEQLAVPLLVRRPADPSAGKSMAGRRSLVALTPSLFDWLAVPRPAHLAAAPGIDAREQSVVADYRSYFREADRRTNLRMAETYPGLASRIVDQHVVYCGRHKLRLAADGAVSWFDLDNDPNEQSDLAIGGHSTAELEKCRRQHRRLVALNRLTRFGAESPIGDSAEAADLETLRALGYVQ